MMSSRTVAAQVPVIVSEPIGLGLLSLRPSENRTRVPSKRGRRTTKRGAQATRRDRAIGGTVKGDILRAVFVRIASWIAKAGATSCQPVVATDGEIASLLPLLIGTGRAARVGRSARERQRALSQMAYDWRAVIGNGATCSSEDGTADVTFYLAGGDGERQFWFTLDVRTKEGRTRIIGPPILGAAPPVPLTEIVNATRVYDAPYMEWAEKIEAAAAAGDTTAIAAAKLIRGLTAAGRGAARVGKGAAYVLAGLVVATVLAFVLPVPTLHAKIVDAVETAIQRLRGYMVKNETSDHSLPPRLRQQGDPTYSSPNFDYYQKSPKEWIINRKSAAADAQKELARHLNEGREHHIEWEWAIRAPYMTARVFKRTENPQLHVIFDRPVHPQELYVGCFPTANVLHQEWDKVAPPGTPAPAPGPMTAIERDAQDVLVISDARTHDEPSPGSPNIETHPP